MGSELEFIGTQFNSLASDLRLELSDELLQRSNLLLFERDDFGKFKGL